MATEVDTRATGREIDWERVFAAVEAKEGALLERLRQIIRIDNCIPPGKNYGTLVDLVEPQFRRFGFETERVVIPEDLWRAIPLPLEGERVNLVASKKSGKPPLSVYAHMDTVPIEEGWDTTRSARRSTTAASTAAASPT